MAKRILVFAPHPDDEILGCGGTIAKRISEGYDAAIVIMTDGRHALSRGFGILSKPTPEELSHIRRQEAIKAAGILGVPITNLHFLDFEDCTLQDNEREAGERISNILRAFSPTELYFPYEGDANPDHQAANRIVRNSIAQLKLRTPEYEYSITQKFSRVGPWVARLFNPLARNLVFIDISRFLDKKKMALGAYKSQMSIVSDKQERPVMRSVDRFTRNKETFYVWRQHEKALKNGIAMVCQYRVREFREGDQADFVKLFNIAHARYSGFVPRNEEYWNWNCRDRPDVEPKGIIVVEEPQSGNIAGYAVVGKSGNIWELCVDPQIDRKLALTLLLDRAGSYLTDVGANQMVINVPIDDEPATSICRQMELSELPPEQMFIGITDFQAVVKDLTNKSAAKLRGFDETVRFELMNARPWVDPVFTLRIGDGEAYGSGDCGLRILIDSDALASVLLGRMKPLTALLRGKLVVKPFLKIAKALSLLNAIQMHNSWFFPLADFG